MAIKFLLVIIILILLFVCLRVQSNFTTSVSSNNITKESLEQRLNEINNQLQDLINERDELQQILGSLHSEIMGSSTTSSSA